jgi:hypothetical protein
MNQESVPLERRRLAKGLKIWLDIIFYLALVAGFIVLVVGPLASITGHEQYEITVPVALSEEALATGGDEAGPILEDARGELRVSPSQLGPKVAFWILGVLLFGAGIYGLILIRRILATAVEGFPFHPENPRRLNHLGWVIVATSVFAGVSQLAFGRWALSLPEHANLPLSPTWEGPGNWILFGLLILVLASIWKQAVQMAEDQSLTV